MVAKQDHKQRMQGRPGADEAGVVGHQLLGVFILALGVAALLGVGYWAYATLYNSAGVGGLFSPVLVAETQDFTNMPDIAIDVRAGRNVAEQDLQGQWEAVFSDERRAALVFQAGQFWLMSFPGQGGRFRRYSFGRYELGEAETGDISHTVVTLNPERDMVPDDLDDPRVDYQVLTHRSYRLSLAFDPAYPGRLLIRPFVVEGLYDQVHPLFFRMEKAEGYTAWSKRKGG